MKVMRFLALGVVLALAACKPTVTDKTAATPPAPVKPALVTVNGNAISEELFEDYVTTLTQGKSSKDLTPEQREQVRDSLVRLELIAQQAEKDGLTKQPDVANRLELARLNLLQQATARNYLKDKLPTDAEMRAEYEAQLATTPLVEYHARHILVSGPDVAQKIIDQLNSGANFATLAKQMSSDKGSAAKGGDLGWFSPTDMAKPFSDAIALLKNGEYTKSPVQTSFGWHVVQLLGTRDRAPPAFEGVQDQIKQMLLSRKFRAYSDEMVRAAKVDPPLANMPAAPTAPASPAATPALAPVTPAEPKTN